MRHTDRYNTGSPISSQDIEDNPHCPLALYDLTVGLWRIQIFHMPGMRKQPEGHSARLSLYPPSAYGPHAQAIHAYFSECKGKNTSRSLDFPTPANAGVLTTIRPQLKDALL